MSKFLLTANQYKIIGWLLYVLFFMLSLCIPVCTLHEQHNSMRIHHVSGAQTLPAAKDTVFSGANTGCFHPRTQHLLILLMSVSLSA